MHARGAERPLPLRVTAAAVSGAFVALCVLERLRPLRPRVEPEARHVARNLLIAGLGGAVVGGLERPLTVPLARWVHRRRGGLVGRLHRWPALRLAVALLDYTLYHWHRLTHRVPLLWRFHAVHHADRDLDASTALRFHAGELLLSIPYRALQVLLIGASPRALSAWQLLMALGILFHHSNLRLSGRVDRALARLVVTPRMHGIHHSRAADERNANWSSAVTSVWNRLHGTLRLDVPQSAVTIGLAELPGRADVRVGRMLLLPLRPREGLPAR
jgi:sterol desaturase/sphingolipid hydroxylase (fatty acid hydroxylase superfamily)